MAAQYSRLIQPLAKQILGMANRHSLWDVFQDFLMMGAVSISNCVDLSHKEAREKEYMDTIQKYSPEEQGQFPILFANLVNTMEQCIREGRMEDVLGKLYQELDLQNEWKGQFFTPQNLSDFMGRITFGDDVQEIIMRRGFITALEPACGSGVMVLGLTNAMRDAGFNYCAELMVDAMDIDIRCVYMAYIQLSLYGIPAVVRHGNALTLEEWSQWYTPIYMLNGWKWRRAFMQQGKAEEIPGEAAKTVQPEPVKVAKQTKREKEKAKCTIKLKETAAGQLTLF